MQTELDRCRHLVQTCFAEVFVPLGQSPVELGVQYALSGGKRLRALLVLESAALHDIEPAQSVWSAAAIEAMHAYSLVHDDLPCMDDDDLRRGQPTVHKKWDEATAVLVGDALQTLSFELLSRPEVSPSCQIRIDLIASLARSSGAQGMVLGQAQDIAAETALTPLDLAAITELQANKTGALIEWSATAGAILGGADPQPLVRYARALGLAFQIQDDVLDVIGDSGKTGKAVGKDQGAGKATFVSLLGVEAAQRRAASLVDEACEAIGPYGNRAETLRATARFVISRET
ncbi:MULTISPECIES: polyprenyl synthetase family protein [Pacificibacter]|uniref:polyprenyl synthetase family protein n=1 Tax=Pacificibacter TaxID=1042323 RepID=UPI001C096AC2|nr:MULTISPECIES: farnesyl diphosphate synthase [Pacificibacter]MBU2936064.1 polyprenyl synthetase family protein [Pacificibacter marinus]MDO6615087.1 polyprenyl synthetase family protein [Pacificibacter sp. 1_MG-2023]